METHLRSEEIGPEFGGEILPLMEPAPERGSSFTALLELPPTQAVELLHSPEIEASAEAAGIWGNYPLHRSPTFPSNAGLLERASKFSVFASVRDSPETSSTAGNLGVVKLEPSDLVSNPNCCDPMVARSDLKLTKRKEREKGKDSKKKKKSKTGANGVNDEEEKLPYVHVRARRGQATDSHSLAERARREKINARMKLLQELVPGCSKISGTALVLDEIINHVQSLQRQVEFLSMRLATVNPRIDFDIDSLLAAQLAGISMDSNSQSMLMPLMWPDGQVSMNQEQYPQLGDFNGLHIPAWGIEEKPNFITPENSLLSHVSSTNSASMHTDQPRMET